MTSSRNLLIVVEGQTDASIIRAILGDELKSKTRFFSGQGRMALPTIARNLLVHEGGPVVIVMDSDTLNPAQSESAQAMAKYAMESVAPTELFRVFMFVPEIEVIFFEAPLALERILGKPAPAEAIQEGLLVPKQTLDRLLKEAGDQKGYIALVSNIDPETASELASGKQAAALIETVKSFVAPTVSAAG
jgi:hypothetical protein